MLSLCLGAGAFLLYLLYDINSFLWKRRIPRSFFVIGSLLILAATVLDLVLAFREHMISGLWDALLLLGAVISLAALIYCLFFALPFKETYVDQSGGRRVYDGGVYALCRHPGILCFFALYIFLGAAALPGRMIINGMIFSLLNLGYAWFQDRVTFPKEFSDYIDYRKRVPFLIPTRASVRMAQQTWVHTRINEEDDS